MIWDADDLRSQAVRCFRAALNCPDPTFAAELIEIGWELREEAERLDECGAQSAARSSISLEPAARPSPRR